MTMPPDLNKARLLEEINASWAALTDVLDALTAAQLTGLTDAAGWTVADHLTHLAAWVDWTVGLIDGVPGWQALGIPQAAYGGDQDAENEAVRRSRAGKPAAEGLAGLRAAHERVLARLEGLTDARLAAPYRERRDDDPPETALPPLADVLYSETAGHYTEHLDWIRALVTA